MMHSGTDAQSSPIYPMRLQKFLARAGVASRRKSEDLMRAGRVYVNGKAVTELGAKVDPLQDRVFVDGVEYRLENDPVYIMLYKPAGVLSTMSDPYARPSVADLVPCAKHPGLFPVGRLDKDTTGILLFTTDGHIAQKLLHPRYEKEKTYVACVAGTLCAEALERLRAGIVLDGKKTAPAFAKRLEAPLSPQEAQWVDAARAQKETQEPISFVELRIHEGKKHQVKRMLAEVGFPVLTLFRPGFGPLWLSDLREGQWRYLKPAEVEALKHSFG